MSVDRCADISAYVYYVISQEIRVISQEIRGISTAILKMIAVLISSSRPSLLDRLHACQTSASPHCWILRSATRASLRDAQDGSSDRRAPVRAPSLETTAQDRTATS